ncbi:MAG: AAA family ATPase [Bacteroidales bacterium]|nr:AAA family ATPase [Bacteroidales bacterium]
MKELIGRKADIQALEKCFSSENPEFVAVYGRRRIGKTFLIKTLFSNRLAFYMTGIYDGTLKQQLEHFASQMSAYSAAHCAVPKDWFEAFELLKAHIVSKGKKRAVVFLDELPWLDSRRSGFVKALELFWNSWGADRDNLMLIVCGSSTTWMTSKIIGNKGGLHNRLTKRIYLAPFTIEETAEYLRSKKIDWSPKQIAECYMALGGTPYYLSLLDRAKTLNANIDTLYFNKQGELRTEFGFLFRSIFNDSNVYHRIVKILSEAPEGLSLNKIAEKLETSKGGSLSTVLKNLCDCDFLSEYKAFGKIQRDTTYKLVDFYSLFYLKFVEGAGLSNWTSSSDDAVCRTWYANAFELLCYCHIDIIKRALGISGVASTVSSWRYSGEEGGAQIDLVIDRRDDVINLCEIKFSRTPFIITQQYADRLEERKELFRTVTKTRKSLRITMITLCGIKQGKYSDCVNDDINFTEIAGLS